MPNERTIRVAKLFKDSRHKLGLTQAEVAARAHLNTNAYAKIERGESEPTAESIRKLIKVLAIDPSKVLF